MVLQTELCKMIMTIETNIRIISTKLFPIIN